MNIWKFHHSSHKFSQEYQNASLKMIFDDKKEDLRRKARLAVSGHLADSSHLESHSSAVQPISARILLAIAAKNNVHVVNGDTGNAFPHADMMEKACAAAGLEFGEREGCLVEIIKNMHGCSTASRAWSLHFSDFMRNLGFVPTRADQDVWIKLEDDAKSCQCASAHAGNFLIADKNPMKSMELFMQNFDIRHAEENSRTYLGSQWTLTPEGCVKVHNAKHVKEIPRKHEIKCSGLGKENAPLPAGCHPEKDDTRCLTGEEITEHLRWIGILQ